MTHRLLIAAMLVLLLGSATLAADGAFVGQWHWNHAESTVPAGAPLPKDIILNITSATPQNVTWTVTVIDQQGQQHVESFSGSGDGKPGKLTGGAPGMSAASTVAATTFETVFTNEDGSTDRSTCSVSGDRKKMTCRGVESDGKGQTANYTDVYERR